jgi:lipopolysaccharide export LptBFGC system permease protein LptF
VDTKVYEVDFHSRVAVSFIALIMSLLAIPYCIRPKRQGGVAKDLSICVGWIFAYWLLFSIALSLGKKGVISPIISVWTLPIVFLGIAMVLVMRARTT